MTATGCGGVGRASQVGGLCERAVATTVVRGAVARLIAVGGSVEEDRRGQRGRGPSGAAWKRTSHGTHSANMMRPTHLHGLQRPFDRQASDCALVESVRPRAAREHKVADLPRVDQVAPHADHVALHERRAGRQLHAQPARVEPVALWLVCRRAAEARNGRVVDEARAIETGGRVANAATIGGAGVEFEHNVRAGLIETDAE